MMTFCTLFDSNYLDKGLVMYRSLMRISKMRIYILAMDDKCLSILNKLDLPCVIVIPLCLFEDIELLQVKQQRSRAEYCWTCTASLIDYIFETYHEKYCTYLDADLYFYQNPKTLIEEMREGGCSVQIVKHGFGSGTESLRQEKASGKYCVQFNTFKNDITGRNILRIWKAQCRLRCSMKPGELGDQKYLNHWPEQYDKVHVLQNPGGGIAPWNISRYRLEEGKNQIIRIKDKKSKKCFEIIFFHFHHLEYMDEDHVDIHVFKHSYGIDKKLVEKIYYPYLKKIEEEKAFLQEQFQFKPMLHKHPGIVTKKMPVWEKTIQYLKAGEILYKIKVKLIWNMGRKKDMIHLCDLKNI